ncbi:MAG: Fe2+-dependent dioxygenase [Proteobacteria bacterium]|uniref:Fe2+-dependent dioxygenase n=1 Tax=Rudaea sp. TaxID=2136325 RepID=UPI0032206C8A|nr:Fe2+-dependent dioxygenase [Pseudomonadota bacterium]
MLNVIEKVLDGDEVRQFRAHLESAQWQDGAATAGSLAREVKHNLQLDERGDAAIALGNHVLRKLGNHALFVSAALPRKIHPPRFNLYRDGGDYGAHVDSAVMRLPGTQDSLRADLAATLFLCDPADYDGGELEIEAGFGAQTVKLGAGDMVLYPASSLHRVAPVTRGARLAAFFWIESLVGDEQMRALLFDLDQSIQQLAPRASAQDPVLLRLTHVYHNLLRRCAAT